MATTSLNKKGIGGVDNVEPAVTPPPSTSNTGFLKKPKITSAKSRKKEIPEGLWVKCEKCSTMLFDKELDENLKVCHHCQYHFQLGARERIESLIEPGSFQELYQNLATLDPLNFPSYPEKIAKYQKAHPGKEAVITGSGLLGQHKVSIAVMDFSFLGGSMGSVVGEKLTRIIELGTEQGLPVIIVSTSGGARMYEGMLSLMQMAKTCGALAYHARKKLPFISILTNPTYAGVMASFASVGDLILAEPGAGIGFAGSRVIKDTTQSELPPGFQTAEFLLDHGLIDAIVPRKDLKDQLAYYLDFMMKGREPKQELAEAV
ncbi:MAG: acetyl-CoA carboxylase, carboxyltransferase subunit beta [Verrucomicrobiales bacterium]